MRRSRRVLIRANESKDAKRAQPYVLPRMCRGETYGAQRRELVFRLICQQVCETGNTGIVADNGRGTNVTWDRSRSD